MPLSRPPPHGSFSLSASYHTSKSFTKGTGLGDAIAPPTLLSPPSPRLSMITHSSKVGKILIVPPVVVVIVVIRLATEPPLLECSVLVLGLHGTLFLEIQILHFKVLIKLKTIPHWHTDVNFMRKYISSCATQKSEHRWFYVVNGMFTITNFFCVAYVSMYFIMKNCTHAVYICMILWIWFLEFSKQWNIFF
jgi:hypothetical protein